MIKCMLSVFLVASLVSCGSNSEKISKTQTVIGTDNRPLQSYDLTVSPRQAIGRLNITPENGSPVSCTGTLVRADVVLTAAHCLVFSGGDKFSFGFFYPAYENDSFSAEYTIKSFVLGSLTPSTIDGRKNDWALVKVEKIWGKAPVPLKMAGIAASSLTYPLTVDLEGYSSDRFNGEVPSFHFGCKLKKLITAAVKSNAPLGTIANDCDAQSGASGGALVQKLLSGYQIVAIIVAGNNDLFDNTANISQAINVAVDTQAASRALATLSSN